MLSCTLTCGNTRCERICVISLVGRTCKLVHWERFVTQFVSLFECALVLWNKIWYRFTFLQVNICRHYAVSNIILHGLRLCIRNMIGAREFLVGNLDEWQWSIRETRCRNENVGRRRITGCNKGKKREKGYWDSLRDYKECLSRHS